MQNKPEPSYDLVNPRPASLIESLRAVGYDISTAIADLIDNSISAGARNIWLSFDWNGSDSAISILDDGSGMDASSLQNAMRIGSQNPLEARNADDLGRFGLGLKTASFSQARKLTVASKSWGSSINARRWNLDYIGDTGEWRLLSLPAETLGAYFERLAELPSGTVVLWTGLDRAVGDVDVNNPAHHARFLDLIEHVEGHLAMVFHRFLEAPPSFRLFVNGNQVKPWDPFCVKEPATQCLTDETVRSLGKRLTVRPYILPHHSKMSEEKLARAAGPKKWLDQQGFYVYRNRRLLVGGDWLGLGFQKEDHYKLARIQVDIPNSMDSEWHIDIKKSRATPPPSLRKDLIRIAELTRRQASEVYRHRGKRLVPAVQGMTMLWEKTVHRGKISYTINRSYPLVEQILSGANASRKNINALLTLIEETVPVPTIIFDGVEKPEEQAKPFETVRRGPQDLIHTVYVGLRQSGLDRSEAITRLLSLEPFSSFPDLVLAMPADEDLF
jgi:hypothetical protein